MIVVVTGGARGIGAGIVASVKAAGGFVVSVSRGAVDGPSRNVRSLRLDITADGASEAILDFAVQAFGHVDAIVNNAAVIRYADCWLHSDADWDDVFACNVTAPFLLSQRFARHWIRERSGGVIVNICSVESEAVFPRQAAYAASKGALLGLTRSMAADLGPHGIRVLAIGPGVIETEMTPESIRATAEATLPLRRLGSPEEIGKATVFALSSMASYLTGTIIYADGGHLLS